MYHDYSDYSCPCWECIIHNFMFSLPCLDYFFLLQVLSCAISPNNKHIVSGSTDKSIILWNLTSGIQLSSFYAQAVILNLHMVSSSASIVATGCPSYGQDHSMVNTDAVTKLCGEQKMWILKVNNVWGLISNVTAVDIYRLQGSVRFAVGESIFLRVLIGQMPDSQCFLTCGGHNNHCFSFIVCHLYGIEY